MSHGSPAFIVFGRKANDCIDWKERKERRENFENKRIVFQGITTIQHIHLLPIQNPNFRLSVSLSLFLLCEERVCGGLPSFLLRALDLERVNEKSPFQIFNSRFEAPFSSLHQTAETSTAIGQCNGG